MAIASDQSTVEQLRERGPSTDERRRRFRRQAADSADSRTVTLPAVPIFDIPLVSVTYDRMVDVVNDALSGRLAKPLSIDAVNTMGMSESCLNERMADALRTYDLVVPDGMPLVWCMNAKGAGLTDRVYGPYLTDRVLTDLKRRTRVAVIGGFDDVHDWLRQ